MVQAEKLISAPNQFDQWIDQHDWYEDVGTINSFTDCPLFRYFTDNGVELKQVQKYHAILSNGEYLHLPQWAQDFIFYFDSESQKFFHKFKKSLSARRTRQILDKAIAE